MVTDYRTQVLEQVGSLQADDPSINQSLQQIGDAIEVGNITASTAIAIGRNIRQIVNYFSLPPEAASAFLDLRAALGTTLGFDSTRYQWGHLIVDKTRAFVGRDHVFRTIDNFIANNASGFLVIEADPGVGKSSILAEYVRRTGCLAHFNLRTLGITSASQFLGNVCAQIILDAQLPYLSLPAVAVRDGAFLLKLLHEAAQRLGSGERLVIAVDALDEVDLSSQPAGSNILFLPNTLPDRVYFILTSRRVKDLPFVSEAVTQTFNLMHYSAENRTDVGRYLNQAANRPRLRLWIENQKLTIDEFVTTMTELSENNFMYLRYMLPEIEEGAYRDLSITKLPKGLEQYYDMHWRKMGMATAPLPRAKLQIIYILCEVHQPVSRWFLARLANTNALPIDELKVQEVLDEWSQFLREQATPDGNQYSVYHASFRDFLFGKEVVKIVGLSMQAVHGLIADSLLGDLSGGNP